MRGHLRRAGRLFTLAFSCWVMAMPLATMSRDALLCRHRAMHDGMAAGTSSGAPCWCSDMAGNATLIAAEAPSLPADHVLLAAGPAPRPVNVALFVAPIPDSPSYAPTPPPPNEPRG